MRFIALFIALTMTAQAAVVWPNGTRLQTFQNGFLFGNNNTLDSVTDQFNFSGGARFEGPLVLEEDATPSNPSSLFSKLYFKTDSNLYKLNSSGTEVNVSSVITGGQQQSGAEFSTQRFPNQQVVRSATGEAFVDTGNENLLLNGEFEHQTYTVGWTSSGTGTRSAETSALISGLKAYKVVTSSQTNNLSQDTTLYAAEIGGRQGLASVWIKNSTTGSKVCPRRNGAQQASLCITLETDGTWRLYEIPFLLGTTSSGIEIDTPSSTGTLIADKAYVGLIKPGMITETGAVGPWISYTPTFQGFGAPTSVETQYRQVGQNLEIRGKFITGTSTAVEARVGLPSGFTSAGTAVIPSLYLSGYATVGLAAAVAGTVLIEPNVAYVTFGQTSIGGFTPLQKRNGDVFAATGNFVSFFASVPIAGLNSRVSLYSQQCRKPSDCENVFSAKISTAPAISEQNLPWLASVSGAITKTITFSSGIFTQTPNCSAIAQQTLSGNIANAQIESISSTQVVVSTANAVGTVGANYAFHIICQKQGADYRERNMITGTFRDVVTSPGAGSPVFYSARISGAGATTIEGPGPTDWINGSCALSLGQRFTCPIISGRFATISTCVLSTTPAGGNQYCGLSSASSSQFVVDCTLNGAPAYVGFDIFCTGVQ